MACYGPGPETAPPPFGRRGDLWTAISRHPGSRPVTSVSLRSVPTTACHFTRRCHRRSHADHLAELGPRSLAPPLFWERCVRAYSRPDTAGRLLQLHSDVRATKPGLSLLLAGTRTVILFLFCRITRSSCEAVTRGKPRIRPNRPSPGAGSSWLPRFARPRYRIDRATPAGL